MEKKRLSPGDQLEAHCTRCREVMNHTLVALQDERPVRVKCNTCGGEHRYHAPREAPQKTAKAAPKKPATRAKADPREAERKEWEALRQNLDTSQATQYTMDGQFKLNSLVEHPLFGLGVVQQVMGDRKICVLFQDGRKVLRCH